MKIAVISDIHGNIDALEAVIEDLEQENCEKVFVVFKVNALNHLKT